MIVDLIRFFRRRARRAWALVAGSVVGASAFAAPAALDVRDAALRAPRPGYTATVATMRLVSRDAARIVGASTPAAGAVELHRVVREGSEVRMVAVPGIPLPAGEQVLLELGEGRFHLMATRLKRPLRSGERVTLRLQVEDDRTRARRTIAVRVPVVGKAAHAADEDHLH